MTSDLCTLHCLFIAAIPLAIPVTWPKGTYSLAKPKAGCPSGEFTWYEGWRLQDTETQTGDNAWSVNNHFAGENFAYIVRRVYIAAAHWAQDYNFIDLGVL